MRRSQERERRTQEITARFTLRPGDLDTSRLCLICAEVSDMSGAGIMMMSGDVQRGSLCTTNTVSALVEEMQFSLGQGPCLDAFRHDQPVLEPDLADPEELRWVAFSERALAAGVRAIFGFPIHVGSVKLGALNLYRDEPGGLTPDEHTDCLVLADNVAHSVISMQAHAAPGHLAEELEHGADLELLVHQASGMVAAQMGVGVTEALARMQAHAFGNDLALRSVARAIVDREIRFDGPADPVPTVHLES